MELVVARWVAVRFNNLLSLCHLWCYCGQEQPVTFGATVAENRLDIFDAIVAKHKLVSFGLKNNTSPLMLL